MNDTQVLEKLTAYCSENIQNSKQSLLYLKNRGISDQSIKDWEIGYFSPSFKEVFKTIPGEKLRQMGIIYDALYSPFVIRKEGYTTTGYITFPIRDQYGNIVALSGRPPISNEDVKLLGVRKYYNTIFEKSRYAFGLYRAIPEIRKRDTVIIGEGQFDTIIAHQYGIKNVVSTCGTALGHQHIKILARYASKLVIAFDSDEAGEIARERVLKDQKRVGIQLQFISLNSSGSKEDIDSFIRKYGSSHFESLLNPPSIDNQLSSLLFAGT